MNILVVTLWDSYNFGAYLQAKALNEVLSRWGNVYFLDIGARNPKKNALKYALSCLFHLNFPGILFEIRKLHYFLKAQKETFKTIKPEQIGNMGIDVAVFGSDEIWNVTRRKTGKLGPVFWGEGLNGIKKISYAPSVSSATYEDFQEWGMAGSLLSDFSSISVRDEHSRSIIEQYTETGVNRVVDPTLLIHDSCVKEKYKKEKCIIMYTFKEASLTMAEEIAKMRNLEIRTLGFERGIGKSVLDKPQNIFNQYNGTEYVITDTFHGTIFAIKHNMQFISYVHGKTKVLKLLEEYGLSERNAMGLTPKEASALLDKKINYDIVNRQIAENREKSLCYLEEALRV